MDLTELYARLSYGELSNLSISGEGSGSIVSGKRPVIVQHLNTALKKLHERFILNEKGLIIRVQEGKLDYRLHSNYSTIGAVTSGYLLPYILDTEEDPFLDDIVCILEAYDDVGVRLPLNDSASVYSLFTPKADIIQIPNQLADSEIALSYQAYPVPIVLDSDDTIDLPVALELALTSYIAHCVYSNMSTETSMIKAQEFLAKYESECGRLEEKNTLSSSNVNSVSKFETNGWV